MQTLLNVIQIALAILLVIVILLQQRGSGMGAAMGGDSSVYRSKRGPDKILFQATIVISILFLAAVIANIFVIA